MAAHLENRLTGQLNHTIGGSTYVDPNTMEWQPSQFERIAMKVLYRDEAKGEMTVLLKWEPGATLPFHRHPEIEQSYVLEGSFSDHDGICRAGEFVWRKAGSLHAHRPRTRCATGLSVPIIATPRSRNWSAHPKSKKSSPTLNTLPICGGRGANG